MKTMLTASNTLLTDPRRLRAVGVNDAGHVVGQDHHRAKHSDDDVYLMRQLKAEGLTYRQIADKFETSRSTVESICLGRRRAHLVVGQKATARA